MSINHCANTSCSGTRTDLQYGLDRIACLGCGRETDMHGNLLPAKPQFLTPVSTLTKSTQQGVPSQKQ
jgi:hypothetical protein